MADANDNIHYLVGVADEPVQHIHAKDQEGAIREFVNGDNYMGYEADEFDGQDVIVVAYSKVQVYAVDIEPPTEANVQLRKVVRFS